MSLYKIKCLCLFIALTASGCKTTSVSTQKSAESSQSDIQAKNHPLDVQSVVAAMRATEAQYYLPGNGYESGYNAPDPNERKKCWTQACPEYCSDIVCAYYCGMPSYAAVVPNVRGCVTSLIRGNPKRCKGGRNMFYPEVTDYCTYQDFDAVLQRQPAYDVKIIQSNKSSGTKPGVLKWVSDNQETVWSSVMNSAYNPFFYNFNQQQDAVNQFFGVKLTNPNYSATDANEIAECNLKRPVRGHSDPADGTHCSYGKKQSLRMHPDILSYAAFVKDPVSETNSPPPDIRFTKLVAVEGFSCGITIDGKVRCWGKNDRGQLGTGDIGINVAIPSQPLSIPDKVVDIKADRDRVCALTEQKTLWCWGDGFTAEGALLARSVQTRPVQIDLQNKKVTRFFMISPLCVETEGKALWCANIYRDQDAKVSSSSPDGFDFKVTRFKEVSGLPQDWMDLALYYFDSVAMIDSQGKIYIGDALFVDGKAPQFTLVSDPAVRFVSFAIGRLHGCAISDAAKVYCWGNGGNGQLGIGETTDNRSFTPFPVKGDVKFIAVAPSYGLHTCGLDQKGRVFCWGFNGNLQLGVEQTGSSNLLVPTEVTSLGNDNSQVVGGSDHTCIIKKNGKFQCFGDSRGGILGIGNYCPP